MPIVFTVDIEVFRQQPAKVPGAMVGKSALCAVQVQKLGLVFYEKVDSLVDRNFDSFTIHSRGSLESPMVRRIRIKWRVLAFHQGVRPVSQISPQLIGVGVI